ncbi:hypothetical protein CRG98_032306 [Punica granatum]|uniref:BHLH domain-containing protein n=1 Tax=Punica granatum TaxID=22663 RepID=A0A2I0ITG2_PUNGR|nr:hypothetical protein CRG98_032306 [Punica granatum]
MDTNACGSNGSFGAGCFDPVGPFPCDFGGRNMASRGGSSAKSQSLVLDSEKGELVKAPVRVAKKNVSEAKAKLALKNHSEAERRRRQRINAHLATLRDLVPSTDKEGLRRGRSGEGRRDMEMRFGLVGGAATEGKRSRAVEGGGGESSQVGTEMRIEERGIERSLLRLPLRLIET